MENQGNRKGGLKYALAQRRLPGTDAERSDAAWLSARRAEMQVLFETAPGAFREFCHEVIEHEENDPAGWSFDLLKSGQRVLGTICDNRRDVAMYDALLGETAAADSKKSAGNTDGIAQRMDEARALAEARARVDAIRAREDAIRTPPRPASGAPHLRIIDGGQPPESRP